VTALVTGAAGFVGSHVVRALLADGQRVRALVRPSSNRRNLADLEVGLVYGDVRDPEALAAAVQRCDTVYHVAAMYSSRPGDAVEMYSVNVLGTKRVLRAALEEGVRRVVLTSTIGTIGRPDSGGPATEECPFNLMESASAYVKSKYLAEVAAESLHQVGLPLVTVHPCAPIGSGDFRPTVTGQRIVDFLRGRRPSYIAGGINTVAVQDVAVGHVLAAESGQDGRHYILGNADGNLNEEQFLGLMEAASNRPIPAPVGPPRRLLQGRPLSRAGGSKPASLTADPTRAIEELGLPQSSLSEAFRDAVSWYLENGYV
jgi:dihydroflavonol-4-reductase